jgi:ABC-2 type transport system ATP-binding protein
MALIETDRLTKVFRLADKRPGLAASVRHLLRPRYRERVAVADVDLRIEAGEAVAYVGPNGAGKSTTVKLLCGIVVPTAGEVRVAGQVPHRHRHANARRIGVLFGQRSQLWWDLPVRDSLALLRDMYGVPGRLYQARLDRFDDLLGLGELLPVVARKLSLGQRMRADLAAVLLHAPSVVYLDEPTIGLDITVKDRVRAFLRQLRDDGTTLLLTTHDLTDIEDVCRRIVIIDAGTVIYDGSIAAIKDRLARDRTAHFDLTGPVPADLVAALPGTRVVPGPLPHQVSVTFDRLGIAAGRVITAVAARAGIADVRIDEPGIEDVVRKVYADGRTAEPAGAPR